MEVISMQMIGRFTLKPALKPVLKSVLKSWMALPGIGLVVFLASAALPGVHAQKEDDELTAATTTLPYAEVQYATLTGTTNTISLTMLPVVLPNGTIDYENVTVPLTATVNSTGVVTITAGTPKVVAAPVSTTARFVAGPYGGPGGGSNQLITVIGPGVTAGGATMWSVTGTAGATGCTWPSSATFYVGPLTSNPEYPRLKKAGITSTAYSYGIMGGQSCGSGGDWWTGGNIVGFSQTASALTIVSFTYGGSDGTDQATPGDQITYTYK
jgi:hypothetical protein